MTSVKNTSRQKLKAILIGTCAMTAFSCVGFSAEAEYDALPTNTQSSTSYEMYPTSSALDVMRQQISRYDENRAADAVIVEYTKDYITSVANAQINRLELNLKYLGKIKIHALNAWSDTISDASRDVINIEYQQQLSILKCNKNSIQSNKSCMSDYVNDTHQAILTLIGLDISGALASIFSCLEETSLCNNANAESALSEIDHAEAEIRNTIRTFHHKLVDIKY